MSYLRELLEGQPERKKRITAFVARVREAWRDLPYPGDDNIVVQFPYLHDDSRQLLEDFSGKRWQDVTLKTLIAHRDNISYFTLVGFRYYIPAYMIVSLTHFYEVDVLKPTRFIALLRNQLNTIGRIIGNGQHRK